MTTFYIGELARRTGATAKTIRYYESLGLLGDAARSEGGYRVYGEVDAARVRFNRSAKALGLSLAEIKEVVELQAHGTRPCGHVGQMLETKLAELDRRIAQLVGFRDELRAYKAQVDAQPVDPGVPCAHIEGVAAGRWQPHPVDPDAPFS